jgi:MFS family permease
VIPRPLIVNAADIRSDLSRIMDSVGITNKDTQALVNGIINIWNFALAFTTAFFVERVERRPLFRISTLGMLTIFTAWTIASAQFAIHEAKSAGIAVIALIFVFQFFYCIAFSPLPVAYSVEVLPYSIRAKGMATYVFSTKCAVFVNQYVNVSAHHSFSPIFHPRFRRLTSIEQPIGLQRAGWKYYIVYVVILAVESFIAYGWFLETKGKALEEIAVIFDGESADVRVAEGKLAIEETENVERKT